MHAPQRIRHWFAQFARRRVQRELNEYQSPPEWRVWPFWRRNPAAGENRQVFRSLVQVNFYRGQRPGSFSGR